MPKPNTNNKVNLFFTLFALIFYCLDEFAIAYTATAPLAAR